MENQSIHAVEMALGDITGKVDRALAVSLKASADGSALADSVGDVLLGKSARLGSFFVSQFCSLFGGRDEAAIPFACAIEAAGAAVRIHADLPALEDRELADGRPAAHVARGEGTALLTGDALFMLACQLIAENQYVSHKAVRSALSVLAEEMGVAGHLDGMARDAGPAPKSYGDLKKSYLRRRGTLIRAACLLGLIAATDKPVQKDISNVKLYAEAVSLAMGIRDDLRAGPPSDGSKNALSFLSQSEAEEEEALLTLLAVEAVSDYAGSELLCKTAIWLLSGKK